MRASFERNAMTTPLGLVLEEFDAGWGKAMPRLYANSQITNCRCDSSN
jgi:hypothetical protein